MRITESVASSLFTQYLQPGVTVGPLFLSYAYHKHCTQSNLSFCPKLTINIVLSRTSYPVLAYHKYCTLIVVRVVYALDVKTVMLENVRQFRFCDSDTCYKPILLGVILS